MEEGRWKKEKILEGPEEAQAHLFRQFLGWERMSRLRKAIFHANDSAKKVQQIGWIEGQ